MTDLIAGQLTLSEVLRVRLQEVVGVMIPASTEFDVPGADDPLIFAEIVAAAGPLVGPVGAALAVLDDMARDQHNSKYDSLEPGVRRALIETLGASGSAHVGLLASLVLPCYYRDDRVVRALGQEPRAPFPEGFELEQGDFSLLDPVRKRGPIWRQV